MLHCKNLSLFYGEKEVLKDFSLSIPLAGITALQGPSGCGKTTLLRAIAGLEHPHTGHIEGISPRETAFLFQENRLFENLTVEKNLMLTARKGFTRGDAQTLLKELGGK